MSTPWRRDYENLSDKLLAEICAPAATLEDWDEHPLRNDARFNELALRIYEFQRRYNSFYRTYIQTSGWKDIASWREIPPVWTRAFKRAHVAAFPVEEASTYFRTSGTTEQESGYHYFPTLKLYESSVLATFRPFVLPDYPKMRMLILTPTPTASPHSSLVHMMKVVRMRFGTSQSQFFIRGGKLDAARLSKELGGAERNGEPVCLLGTAFAFAFFLEFAKNARTRFQLPPGSRIMETGGFKGRVREIPRPQFYRNLVDAFGIPETHIINEYSMTELSSQFYDSTLAEILAKRKARKEPRIKKGPPWARIRIVDPLSGRDVSIGQPGLIRIYDLANLGSVISIQTEDVGIRHPSGFEIVGRVASASPRGCSLETESLLKSVGEKSR